MKLTDYISQATKRDAAATSQLESCTNCGVPLQEALAGYRKTELGTHCSDCYFDALSEMIDQYPVGKPLIARGHAA